MPGVPARPGRPAAPAGSDTEGMRRHRPSTTLLPFAVGGLMLIGWASRPAAAEGPKPDPNPGPKVEVKAGERRGVWAISTELDRDGHMWTAECPDAIVARRVQAIARASWTALQEIENPEFDAKVCSLLFLLRGGVLTRVDPLRPPH